MLVFVEQRHIDAGVKGKDRPYGDLKDGWVFTERSRQAHTARKVFGEDTMDLLGPKLFFTYDRLRMFEPLGSGRLRLILRPSKGGSYATYRPR